MLVCSILFHFTCLFPSLQLYFSADSNVAHNELTFFFQTSPYLKSSTANIGLYYLRRIFKLTTRTTRVRDW